MSRGYSRRGPRSGGVMYQMQAKRPDGTWDDSGRIYRRRYDAINGYTKMPAELADKHRLAMVRLEVVEVVPGRVIAGHGTSVQLKGKPEGEVAYVGEAEDVV